MASKLKKSEFDPDTTLVDLEFILKGKGQVITVTTTCTESCALIDYLNKNDAGFRSYSREVRERFNNKFCMLRDYSAKKDMLINYSDIKVMTIPFFIEKGEDIEFKKLIIR